MNNLVKFNNHDLQIVEYNNEYCFQSQQIVDALELDSRQTLNNIFNRHKNEFIGFTYLPTKGRPRLFNREGAWLIGMFARTPKAAEFRKWVLKVLGAVTDSSPAAQNDAKGEVAVKEHTRSLPSGKKEIVLSDKAKSEIGGIVKAIVQAELMKVFAGSGLEVNPSGMPFANWAVSAVHAVGAMQSEYQALKQKQQQAVRLLENKAD